MAINKSGLPGKSILKIGGNSFDYIDSFRGEFIDNNQNIGLADIARTFLTSSPKWVGVLFSFRNKVVGLFGLKPSGKHADRQKQLENLNWEPGTQVGLFKVFNKTNNEVVLGENDKHLDFRVSLFIDKQSNSILKKTLTISTTVIFNNRVGRLYFFLVRPFHKLIVPSMLRGTIKELEKQAKEKNIDYTSQYQQQ